MYGDTQTTNTAYYVYAAKTLKGNDGILLITLTHRKKI